MSILVGIDESSGTQDTAGPPSSNDVSLAIPVQFLNALNFETLAGTVDPVVATALSGATSPTSTGSQVITFSGAVQDVGFTTSAGAAVSALDSGLTTTAGRKIFLYTSSHDNNVLLGREANADGSANSSGAVAFAMYLDTGTGSTSDVGATGAKLWVTQYEAIHHPDGTNPNDFVTMAQDLFVTVNTLQNFSLSGAPSGNNLFLMFGDGTPSTTDVTIVVTGEHPADQSAGANVSSGDTVVSSQGGVGDTTLGTNNQMVDPGEGMFFTFVKGADPDFTIPNLTPTEANVEANIRFTSVVPASAASFLISQLQPSSKEATVRLTAVNDPTVSSGVDFVNTLVNNDGDDTVNISTITVTRTVLLKKVPTTTTYTFTEANNTTQAGITVDFSGKTATITGLLAGDRLAYVADGTHDRLLVENPGNTDANLASSFDIGGFRLDSGAKSTLDLGNVAFFDDGPTASAALGTGSVINDETAGLQTASGANDTNSTTVANLFSGVTTVSTQLGGAEYAQGTASAVDSSGTSFGVDGQAASGATVYSLAVSTTGVDSGLTTDDGTHILLYKEGSLVVGRIGSQAGAAAFAVAIDASSGVLSMAQYSAVKHPTTTDPNDSVSVTNSAISAVVTVTDGDGDTSTASVAIGSKVQILDDGPTANAALGTGSVVIDETPGNQGAPANDTSSTTVSSLFSGVSNKSTQLATAGFAQGSAAVVDGSQSTYGADGQATTGASAYSLAVSTAGVDSGITTDDGTHILLYKESNLVVGRIGSQNGAAAFAVAIDATTGILSMAQYSAVHHPVTSDPNDSVSIANSALQAVVTVKDGDGDTNSASVGIGNRVSILDDGPALAFGNLVGTGTINPQLGAWSMSPGVDGLGPNGVDIAMTSFQLVKPDNTVVAGSSFTFGETSPSPDTSGNYHFSGSVTGDLDNNASTPDVTEHFTMTVFANGTWNIDLVEGFQSTVTESTANGSLGAGGPDAVQTLTVGSDSIVFFSAFALADPALVVSTGIEQGLADFTEAQLEAAKPSVIDFTKAMNVSTSGIGDQNNNLQGDSNAAIGSGDESFVANPHMGFTSAKVFIDNSVTGYNFTGGERLYYRMYFVDGTYSDQILVGANVATTGSKPQPFSIDSGGKVMDAIQLTMATGTVKIPEIQFTLTTNNLADGLKLGFNASIADGDGDTASSAFVANLAANSLGTSFDYVLNGTANALDWFNIDLTQSQTKYQVNGFDAGTTLRDKLVLLGSTGAGVSIDNSGANAVVTVTEAGGQVDTITVVGVHLLSTDLQLA